MSLLKDWRESITARHDAAKADGDIAYANRLASLCSALEADLKLPLTYKTMLPLPPEPDEVDEVDDVESDSWDRPLTEGEKEIQREGLRDTLNMLGRMMARNRAFREMEDAGDVN